MVEVKPPRRPIISSGDDGEIKREEKEQKKVQDKYFGDGDVGVSL